MRRLLFVAGFIACTGSTPDVPDEPEDPLRALVIESPAPATWTTQGPVDVSGTYENLVNLRVGETPATVGDGTFSGATELIRGTNLVRASGESPGGTLYQAHVGLIAGPVADPEQAIADAAQVRLNEPGLDLAMSVAAGLIDEEAIEAILLASNPVYSKVDDPELTVDATSFALGGTALDIDALDGSARLTATLTDLAIGADISGRSGRLTVDLSQTLSATTAVVTGDLGITVQEGEFRTTLTNVDVVLTGFAVDTSNWPSWLTGSLTDLLLTEIVEGLIRGFLPDLLPAVIDEQLNSLDLSFQTTLLERPAQVKARITSAEFDPDGLAIGTELDVDIDGLQPKEAPGYLAGATGSATADTTSDLSLTLTDDLLNMAAFEAWRAGLLTYTLSTQEGTLPPYVLDALGGARNGVVQISADLPPTIVEEEGQLRAQIAELRIRIDTIDGDNGSYLILAAGGHIDLDLAVEDGVLKVSFGKKSIELTVRQTDWTGSLVEVTQVVEGLLPIEIALALLGDLEFPLPTVAGLKVQGADVQRSSTTLHSRVAVDLEPTDR
ncbi:MAG: hypothetical protein AB8H79_26610 [Myxococcota bacterium]